jgi:hypothetical protein
MSLKQKNSIDWEGEYTEFIQFGLSESGKTYIWLVNNKHGIRLGDVRWCAPWRCYAFVAQGNCWFEQKCLRDIGEFVETRNKEHKEE